MEKFLSHFTLFCIFFGDLILQNNIFSVTFSQDCMFALILAQYFYDA